MVQSRYLNLCIFPEILVLISTPHPFEGSSLPQNPASSLPDPPTSFVEPRDEVVAATPSLRIPFPVPHTFSSGHQLGFPVSPLIQGFPFYVPLFLPYWSCIGLIGAPLFWGGFNISHGMAGCTYGFQWVS